MMAVSIVSFIWSSSLSEALHAPIHPRLGGLLFGKHRKSHCESLHIFQSWHLSSEVKPRCLLRRSGEGATLYVCQQGWSSFINWNLTKLNSTSDTYNEGVTVGCPHVLNHSRSPGIDARYLFAIKFSGGHRETKLSPGSSTPYLQRDASGCVIPIVEQRVDRAIPRD
jgi:hypothetical protein